jgi:hypothetical protein
MKMNKVQYDNLFTHSLKYLKLQTIWVTLNYFTLKLSCFVPSFTTDYPRSGQQAAFNIYCWLCTRRPFGGR